MLLENPAPVLNIGIQDILGILESTLREKNWKHFELANLKLVYTPHYVFNYDALREEEIKGQTLSESTSGVMAMNAITGHLEPVLQHVMEKQPVSYEKDISHDLQYEIEKPAITRKEVSESCKVKIAGQLSIKKDNVSISGARLVYWPVWRIFVTLPNQIQKVEIEAVAGIALNFEEVPTREKGWLEVTTETLRKMKSPGGWADISKKAAGAARGSVKTAVTKETDEETKSQGITYWLLHTDAGRYTTLLILLLVFVLLIFQ
jgi:hypothetical protein